MEYDIYEHLLALRCSCLALILCVIFKVDVSYNCACATYYIAVRDDSPTSIAHRCL